jgi:superfamily I DNA/RNA helicase
MPLPIPKGRQREVLALPAEGHFVVLGTAGSGKTVMAIYRAAFLSEPGTAHSGRTLLLTFNKTLVAYLRHIGSGELSRVVIENYHRFARGYLNSRGLMRRNGILGGGSARQAIVAAAVREVAKGYKDHPFFKRPIALFDEEFAWLARHGVKTAAEYVEARRVGRADARIERSLREIVWKMYEIYKMKRSQAGFDFDWDDIASAVADQLDNDPSERRYRHIVVDEGQDFSPEMLRSLTKAVPSNGSFTFFGDVAQQIYGQRMSWRSAGIHTPKVWEFRDNYRNTRQIARLGLAVTKMPYYVGAPDMVEPVAPTADGPLPTVVRCPSIDEEVQLVVNQAITAARTRSVGIFVRRRADEQRFVKHLPGGSLRLHGNMTRWVERSMIYYGTYHSAKGLEFHLVVLPFCSREWLPDPEDVQAFGESDATANDGRLLYVGITRAKTGLVITYTGEITQLLPSQASLYQKVEP